jgi:hypothetical protein
MTKSDKIEMKQFITDELVRHRQEICKPHEERLGEMEKQMVQIFCNGLKSSVEETKEKVEQMMSQRWVIPLSITLSILATYFINKLL